MKNKCTIITDYKKRTTLADKFPMTMLISSGNDSQIIDNIRNVGKGSITLTYDITKINVNVDGKIEVNFKDSLEHGKYIDINSVIIIDTTKITLIDETEIPDFELHHSDESMIGN